MPWLPSIRVATVANNSAFGPLKAGTWKHAQATHWHQITIHFAATCARNHSLERNSSHATLANKKSVLNSASASFVVYNSFAWMHSTGISRPSTVQQKRKHFLVLTVTLCALATMISNDTLNWSTSSMPLPGITTIRVSAAYMMRVNSSWIHRASLVWLNSRRVWRFLQLRLLLVLCRRSIWIKKKIAAIKFNTRIPLGKVSPLRMATRTLTIVELQWILLVILEPLGEMTLSRMRDWTTALKRILREFKRSQIWIWRLLNLPTQESLVRERYRKRSRVSPVSLHCTSYQQLLMEQRYRAWCHWIDSMFYCRSSQVKPLARKPFHWSVQRRLPVLTSSKTWKEKLTCRNNLEWIVAPRPRLLRRL